MDLDLEAAYRRRFQQHVDYRNGVWKILVNSWFSQWISPTSRLLDLGCGWGEFINHARAASRWGMDLNPESRSHIQSGVELLPHDCTQPWPLSDDSLDVVFTSNLFEHLESKEALGRTLREARRCLAPGGRIICIGPNIRALPGAYWDFWDHILPLTERSLSEALELEGFRITKSLARFLPYNMSGRFKPPLFLVHMYLRLPWAWPMFGRQFLVIAESPESE
jgi:SAM-dependent methyltransferase